MRAAAGAAPGPPDHPLGPLHGVVASQRAPSQEGLRLRHGQRADLPDLPVRGGARGRRRRGAAQHRRVPHEALRVHVPGLQVPGAGPSGAGARESAARGKPRGSGEGRGAGAAPGPGGAVRGCVGLRDPRAAAVSVAREVGAPRGRCAALRPRR